MVLQSYEHIYNKIYEHHNENFKESILRHITHFRLQIKKNPWCPHHISRIDEIRT